MFSPIDIFGIGSEKAEHRILKPVWIVLAEYVVKFLVLLSLLYAGMEVTFGRFECLPAVKCPGNSMSNSSWKNHNVCEQFYSSVKSRNTGNTYVITDIKTVIQYSGFVNSECSKGLHSWTSIALFADAFLFLLLCHLWLKIPTTAAYIENFVMLVIECYNSPISHSSITEILDMPTTLESASAENSVKINQILQNMIEDDFGKTGKRLLEKVKQFKDDIDSSHKFVKIRWLYLIQCVLQSVLSVASFAYAVYFVANGKYLKEKITCTMTHEIHIPVTHEYFICSHRLANGLTVVLSMYTAALGINILIFSGTLTWTIWKTWKKCEYNFTNERLPDSVSAPNPAKDDLAFLLHLLHLSNKLCVVRFAAYVKKLQTYDLTRIWSVSRLKDELKEDKLTLKEISGIPLTIIHLAEDIHELELTKCGPLANDDFKHFIKLRNLKKLSIIRCNLKQIPENILKMKNLEKLYLNENLIEYICLDESNHKLINLTTLDLSDNKQLIKIESLEGFKKLSVVNLDGNECLEKSEGLYKLYDLLGDQLVLPKHLRHIGVVISNNFSDGSTFSLPLLPPYERNRRFGEGNCLSPELLNLQPR